MPLDVGETINGMADAFLKAPAIKSIVKNPIYTALVITFIIVLIVMFIFRNAETDESLLVMCLRSGFWIFIMLLSVLFLHNKVLVAENNDDIKNTAYDGVFNGGFSGAIADGQSLPKTLEGSVVPIRPHVLNRSEVNIY